MFGVTIGNFDGVHLGHRRLLEAVRRVVGPAGRVIAVTFDPDPATVLGYPSPDRLMSVPRRQEMLRRQGADDERAADLIHDLVVNRAGVGGVYGDQHGLVHLCTGLLIHPGCVNVKRKDAFGWWRAGQREGGKGCDCGPRS